MFRSRPPWPETVLIEGRVCQGIYLWRVAGFFQLLQDAIDGKITYSDSPPIYTSLYGYKLCMRIFPNGVNDGVGRHVGLFVGMVQGEYDDILEWPFNARISLTILDQSGAEFRNDISGTFLAKRNMMAFKKPIADAHEFNLHGYAEFAPIQLVCSPEYMKDDTIMVKIEIKR